MPLRINPISGDLDLVGDPGAGGNSTNLTGDVGAAVTPDGADSISLIGDATQAYLQTTGTPASNKMEIKLLEPAADGELLIGHTANAEPSVATLTAGSGISVVNAAGSITIASTSSDSLVMPTDSGTGTAVAGSMDLFGGTGVSTAASGNTVTINASAAVPTAFTTDSGTGTPSGNSLAVNGGTGINTSGAGAGVTVNIDNPVIVAQGGSERQSATAYAPICGGTTSTAAHQSIASLGTSGQLLTSNGVGALPSMKAGPAPESLTTALTAGSVVFSDGTNLTEDNANFFWDDTNNRLGIGTTTPSDDLQVIGSIDLNHTAAEDDDHALEIICDAAGFADVKAVDIVYTTGAIVAGDDEEAILVNIDESASLGGEVSGYEIIATEEGAATIHGYTTGINISPVLHNSGTFGDIDNILNKAVDVTAALASGGAGNISVFVADNDTVTYGDAAKFNEMEFILDTAASGSGIAPTFEFSTGGSGFTAFTPADGTNGLRNTGAALWVVADLSGWATNASGLFEVRHTRTRNSLSTTPILDEVQLSLTTEYSWNKDGDLDVKSIDIDTGQAFTINDVDTLNATTLGSAVVTSSLTTVGTVGTGVWQGTAVADEYGGTGQTTYTKGDILYASAANTLSKLAIGSDNQILTVATDIPAWETPAASGSGAWVWLSSSTASSSSSVEFDNTIITSTYSHYHITIRNLYSATNNAFFKMLFSNDNGSTFETTNYRSLLEWTDTVTSTSMVPLTVQSGTKGIGTATNEGDYSCEIDIYQPADSGSFTGVKVNGVYVGANSASLYNFQTGSVYQVAETINAVQFILSTGNIASGEIIVYGIKES